jgi:hypothetical protein
MGHGGEKSVGGQWLPFKGVAGDTREGGGSYNGDAMWRGVRGAWLRSAGGVSTMSRSTATRPRRARAAHLCFSNGAPTWLTHGARLVCGKVIHRVLRKMTS